MRSRVYRRILNSNILFSSLAALMNFTRTLCVMALTYLMARDSIDPFRFIYNTYTYTSCMYGKTIRQTVVSRTRQRMTIELRYLSFYGRAILCRLVLYLRGADNFVC